MSGEEGEHRLLPLVKEFLLSEMSYDQSCMLEEVPSPWGRPDLVAFEGSRDDIGLGLPDPAAIRLLCFLQRESPIRMRDLQARLGMGRTSLAKLVHALVNPGLVRAGEDGLLLGAGLPPPLPGLCAVEIKVRDWRSGLRQATRYESFSDSAYLFLGSVSPKIDLPRFKRTGVGLVSLAEPSEEILPARPSSEHNISVGRMLVENRIRGLLS